MIDRLIDNLMVDYIMQDAIVRICSNIELKWILIFLRQGFNVKCRLFNVAGYMWSIFKVWIWLSWLSFMCAISFLFQICQIIQWLPRSHLVTCPIVKIKNSYSFLWSQWAWQYKVKFHVYVQEENGIRAMLITS